ncbi:MAG: nitroreductase [Kangiellaceae bacterium]|nr:nitroreductase [Kangiellaceae bacterium]
MNNPTQYAIHSLMQTRWSPYAIDPERSVASDDIAALFEAARWTMSSYNAQPWRYIIGVKGRSQDVWDKIFSTIVEGNRPWAKNAPVLTLALAEHFFEHNGKPNKAALHDIGAASASITYEATARGLSVHQMIGIDPDKAREVFNLEDNLEPFTALAIGYHGGESTLEESFLKRDLRKRERKSLDEIVIGGGW